jgi:hypothetical protein
LTLPEAGDRYSQDNEQETRRLIELAFSRAAPGGSGALPSRRTVEHTSASMAASATVTESFDLGAPGAVLRTIESDRASRVRFYSTASAQSDDLTRAFTTPPQAGLGILGDFIWQTSHTKIVSPHLDLFNADNPVSNTLYITIQNLTGSSSTVLVTMVVVSVES